MSETQVDTFGAATQTAFSIGLGLTNECNLGVSFCYRDPTRSDRLTVDQVRAVLDSVPIRTR